MFKILKYKSYSILNAKDSYRTKQIQNFKNQCP